MIKSSRTWWDRFLFRDKGVLPTRRLILFFLILAIPNVIITFLGYGWRSFFIFNGLLLLISFIDGLRLPSKKALSLVREIPAEVERGRVFRVSLTLSNPTRESIRFTLIDGLPRSFVNPFPLRGEVKADSTQTFFYETEAAIRGHYLLTTLYFRYQSGLGLWEKQMVFSDYQKVRVIPDMSYVKETLASAQAVLIREGIRIRKNRMGAGEFSSIRSYVAGDDPRKINWRQTAKQAEMMTNVDEPEHGKQIMLLIDCSRIMGVELTEVNRLERAVEAALTVAAAALRQGDAVGVVAFSNTIHAAIPPRKGASHLQVLIKGLYAIQATKEAASYEWAFEYLETIQSRRSLVILFSHFDVILYDDTVFRLMERLRRRHLFLTFSITDPMIKQWVEAMPANTRTAMTKAMAQKDVLMRKKKIRAWENLGLNMVEVPEEKLALSALSEYFAVLNRGVL